MGWGTRLFFSANCTAACLHTVPAGVAVGPVLVHVTGVTAGVIPNPLEDAVVAPHGGRGNHADDEEEH